MTEVWVVTESGYEHTAVIAVTQSQEAAKAIGEQHQANYLREKQRLWDEGEAEANWKAQWTAASTEWCPSETEPKALTLTAAFWRGKDWDRIEIFPVPLDTYGGPFGWPYGPRPEYDSDD